MKKNIRNAMALYESGTPSITQGTRHMKEAYELGKAI